MAPLHHVVAEFSGARLGLALVAAGDRLLVADPLMPIPCTIEGLANALAIRIRRCAAGIVPREIRVRYGVLADALRPALAATPSLAGVRLTAARSLPVLERTAAEPLQSLGAALVRQGMSHAPTWGAWKLPARIVRDLFGAAAGFYRAAPWRSLASDQFVFVDLPSDENWGASVLGQVGEQVGLTLYSEPEDYFALFDRAPGDHRIRALKGAMLTLTFLPADELGPVARKQVMAAGWEVAGPAAYPDLITVNASGIDRKGAGVLTAVLRLLPQFIERHRSSLASAKPPREPIEWRDPLTGIELGYDGRASEAAMTLFGSVAPLVRALPTGPAARPEAALAPEADRVAADSRIMRRHSEHLAGLRLKPATIAGHLLVAAKFVDFLDHTQGVSLASATELDLRLFLYGAAPQARDEFPPIVFVGIPRSLGRLIRYLRRHEGIDYRWAEAILRDRETFAECACSFRDIGRSAKTADEAQRALRRWRTQLKVDLGTRLLIPSDDIPGGAPWRDAAGPVAEVLRRELERRWLFWRDDLIRRRVTKPDFLAAELTARRLAWERSPHPAHGGRTPVELVGGDSRTKHRRAPREAHP